MVDKHEIALHTAEYLLQIQAVKLSPEQHFTWASGWYSPIYCDNRITLSYPKVREFIADSMAKIVKAESNQACLELPRRDLSYANIIKNNDTQPDVIAGVATGAIAIGMLVAGRLGLPFVYVRPEPKKHGRQNQIEGELPENARVVVIEDLISTGGSSLAAVQALRDHGAEVLYMVSIMTYGFEVAEENFKKADLNLISLCNYDTLISRAVEKSYVRAEDVQLLSQWRKSPHTWKK